MIFQIQLFDTQRGFNFQLPIAHFVALPLSSVYALVISFQCYSLDTNSMCKRIIIIWKLIHSKLWWSIPIDYLSSTDFQTKLTSDCLGSKKNFEIILKLFPVPRPHLLWWSGKKKKLHSWCDGNDSEEWNGQDWKVVGGGGACHPWRYRKRWSILRFIAWEPWILSKDVVLAAQYSKYSKFT